MKSLLFVGFAVLCIGVNSTFAQPETPDAESAQPKTPDTDFAPDLDRLPIFKKEGENGLRLFIKPRFSLGNLEQAAKTGVKPRDTTETFRVYGSNDVVTLHYGPYTSFPIYPDINVGGKFIPSPSPDWEKREFNGGEYYFIPLPTKSRA